MTPNQNTAFDNTHFDELLSQMLDGRLAADQQQQLARQLDQDQHLREQYAELMQLHALLYWKESESLLGLLADEDLPAEHASEPANPEPVGPAVMPIATRLARGIDWRRRPLYFAATVAALWFGVWLLFGASMLPWDQGEVVRRSESSTAAHRPTVARLRRSVDAEFGPRSPRLFAGAFLRAGQTIDVQQGLVELDFHNGAEVILEAPAVFILQAADAEAHGAGLLEQGKIVAQVPERAAGFTVLTQSAAIVDLGTEFGAEVDAAGETLVVVFDGEVEVGSTDPDDQHRQRLVAGQSLRIGRSGGAVAVAAVDLSEARQQFVRSLPPQTLPSPRQAISINFGTGPRTALAPLERAGVVRVSSWNNIISPAEQAGEGTQRALIDSQGDSTTARVAWRLGYFNWNDNHGAGDRRMMTGWGGLAAPRPGRSPEEITVSELPESVTRHGYDVYVYFDSRETGTGRTMQFTLGSMIRIGQEEPQNFTGRFREAAGDSLETAEVGNYVVFRGLTSPEFTLTGHAGKWRATVNGIQIVGARAPTP